MLLEIDKNNKIIMSSHTKDVPYRILINEEPINFQINYIDENHSELELFLQSSWPLNVFLAFTLLNKENQIIDVTFKQNGIFPIHYFDVRVGLLVTLGETTLLKVIEYFDKFDQEEMYDLSSTKKINVIDKIEQSIIDLTELDEKKYKYLVTVARQKETNITHIIPTNINNNKLTIPKEYQSGLFDIEVLLLLNNVVFRVHSLFFDRNLIHDMFDYNVSNVKEQSFIIEFRKKIIGLDKVYLLTDDLLYEGQTEESNEIALFDNVKIGNTEKLFLMVEMDYGILFQSIRTNQQLYQTGMLRDYVDPKTYEFSYDLIKDSENLSVFDFTVLENKVTFKIEETIVNEFNNEPYLLIHERKTTEIFTLKGSRMNNRYVFDFSPFLKTVYQKGNSIRWDIYLLHNSEASICYQLGFFDDKKIDKPNKFYDFFKRDQEVNSTYTHRARVYVNANQKLSVVKNSISNLIKEQFDLKVTIDKFSMKKNIVNLRMNLKSKYLQAENIGDIYLIHRNKDGLDALNFPVVKIVESNGGKFISSEIDLLKKNIYPLFWDVYIGIKVNGKEYFIKVTKVKDEIILDVDDTISKYQLDFGNNEIIYPYITISKDLAFAFRQKEYFENKYYLFKENVAYYISKVFKKVLYKKDIWLTFEKLSMSAHDSSYYFFDYVYKNNKHKNFYYIIRKDSPELENLKSYKDKVIYFMSFKYFIYMFGANLLISSDTKRNSYNLKLKKGKLSKELTNKKLVYLQHGVNGLKVVKDFHKNRDVFDLVIAPSEYEKEMIIKDWGYKSSEVVTTGLARWDALRDKSNEIPYRQIFLMPTWRTWMDGMPKDKFLDSEYFKKYSEFLTSKRLHQLLEENNIHLKFFLHPKFKEYIDLFNTQSTYIEKFGFLEVPMDEMIMKSSLMITDYSSVIWEMFYLQKPCAFFHFDRDKYLEYEGAYMNLEKDLFGDVAFETEDLIDIVENYIQNDFQEKEEFATLRDDYFTYMDNKNSERIFNAIEEKRPVLYENKKKKRRKLSHIIPFKIRRKILNIKDKVLS